MIKFFADNHFGTHAGKHIAKALSTDFEMDFYEDDFSVLESFSWEPECELLILHMIGTTCDLPHPNGFAEEAVRAYCERGGNILLLHGSSAAFWQWKWWREIVGLRWVRPQDPDDVASSIHPNHPCRVVPAKCRHKLVHSLKSMDLAADEIYINLETTAPMMPLMETTIPEGTFVQAYETVDQWGGRIVGFIPGHDKANTTLPELQDNVKILVHYLLEH